RGGECDVDLVIEQVTWDIDHYRPAAPSVGNPEGFENELGDALRAWHTEGALGYRLEQGVLGNLLEGVTPQGVSARQPEEAPPGRIRRFRRRQPQDLVGCARPRLPTDEHPRRLRDPPIGVGHVHAAVLVPHTDIGDVCGVVERVVDLECARAHQSEDRRHPYSAQCFYGCDPAPHCWHGVLSPLWMGPSLLFGVPVTQEDRRYHSPLQGEGHSHAEIVSALRQGAYITWSALGER